MSSRVSSYIQLTKPRIVLLVLVTALAALVMEGSLLREPGRLLLVLFAITLVAGSANAFNQYFERDLDAQMARTRTRRPLPLQHVTARSALGFAIALCVKEDYRKVRIPMLPLVRGDAETYRQIEIYSVALVALTLAMPFLRTGGLIYAVLALGLGAVFVWKAVRARRLATVGSAWEVFGFSILYLFVLFLGLIAHAIWRIPIL